MNLKVNQRVEIVLDEEPYKGSYVSRVENIEGKLITLAMPMAHGALVPIHSGTTASIVFFDELAVYEMRAKVTRAWQEKIPVLMLEYPDEVKRIQRRAFVRLEMNLPFTLFFPNDQGGLDLFVGETSDLSGGGAKVLLPKKEFCALSDLTPKKDLTGEKLKMSVALMGLNQEKTEMVDFVGEIIRHGVSGLCFWLAISFSVISEKNRDKIIGYIFRKQLELRNKGLM